MQMLSFLVTEFGNLVNSVAGTYDTYRHCKRCGRTTVWDINTMQGRNRCKSCNRGPAGG